MNRDAFTETIRAFKNRLPLRPFTVATMNGNRHEIDFSDALAVREGIAVYVGPGKVPVFFDHESVSEIIGDLSGRGVEAGWR